MKIDLVYLWVDGSDETWLAKKNAALSKIGKPPTQSSVSANRWRDNDELKYSLRSVEKFVPWINHVFIITDNQVPAWLNSESSRVTIIDHKQIIPNDKLPLFNANAIEMFLWKIPELSERFLYANDDMFFGKPIEPSFFFDESGNPIVIMKERRRSFKNLDDQSSVSSRLYMIKSVRTIKYAYKKFNKKFHLAFKHAIEPIRRSYMEENFKDLEDDLLATTVTPFRDVNNIQRIIMPLLDNAKGRNTIVLNWRAGGKRIVYDNKKDNSIYTAYHWLLWLFAVVTGSVRYDCYDKRWRIVKFLEKYRPTLFAINDFSSKGAAFESAAGLIEKMFPNKSEFEK